ncbi:hypothetical protein B296_00045557 [Ensete ventricosum]|uniref:Xyloglucan endotransglucosylase/hydrolase n=1 Tax=Ensete ventricosum TaxID=4639 RepID=A0A426Y8F2_ENSVE|nr:hypothetical protein B296_00045557 [Ensete ventricosum]
MASFASSAVTVLIVLGLVSVTTLAGTPRRPIDVPFQKNYVPTWAYDHIKYFNEGREVQLYLDKNTGKMLALEVTNQPYILQTNVFTGGKGDREQRIYLWFDPTKDYHSYSVLWNMYQIQLRSFLVIFVIDNAAQINKLLESLTGMVVAHTVVSSSRNRNQNHSFYVDDVPIRVFKNSKDLGVRYPFNQPMKIYSSLWNGDDWATRGGLEKTDWSKAPFVAAYRGFHIDGCEASAEAKFCATQGMRWWDQKEFRDLDGLQYRRLQWVRQKYTIYNYCTDRKRYPAMPPECRRDKDV